MKITLILNVCWSEPPAIKEILSSSEQEKKISFEKAQGNSLQFRDLRISGANHFFKLVLQRNLCKFKEINFNLVDLTLIQQGLIGSLFTEIVVREIKRVFIKFIIYRKP